MQTGNLCRQPTTATETQPERPTNTLLYGLIFFASACGVPDTPKERVSTTAALSTARACNQNSERLFDRVRRGLVGLDVQRLRKKYKGPLIQVRRSSDDAIQTIGADCHDLDTRAFNRFVGGDTATLNRILDQSGNGHDAIQRVASRRPKVVDNGSGRKVFSFAGSQGMSISGAFDKISGANALTVFFAARWNGTSTERQMVTFGAGLTWPGGAQWPLSMFLRRNTNPQLTGTPVAMFRLSDRSRHEIGAKGTFGRANVNEIHEFVFHKDRGAELYNSGRLVSKIPGKGLPLLVAAERGDGLVFGNTADYKNGFRGEMTAPLIFDRALSASERAKVRKSIASHYKFELPNNKRPGKDEFTIVYLPDTQLYAAGQGDDELPMRAAMAWIKKARKNWKIRLVTHGGDVVDRAANREEWFEARDWFDVLDTANIPYSVPPGNHDYIGKVRNRDSTVFNEFFSPARLRNQPWWNGQMFERGKTDNAWFIMKSEGQRYLILNLEFQPRRAVIAWANQVLARHRDKKAIIVTHEFLNEGGALDSKPFVSGNDFTPASKIYSDLVKKHRNIFLVLNGHHARGSARRFDKASGAHFLFFDEFLNPERKKQGWIRLMVVSPKKGTVRVMTYSPFLKRFRNDYQSQFTLP